jgi:hypothetical protein
MLAPRAIHKLENRPLSAVRNGFLNIFAAAVSSICNPRTRHAVVTSTPLTWSPEMLRQKNSHVFKAVLLNLFIILSESLNPITCKRNTSVYCLPHWYRGGFRSVARSVIAVPCCVKSVTRTNRILRGAMQCALWFQEEQFEYIYRLRNFGVVEAWTASFYVNKKT